MIEKTYGLAFPVTKNPLGFFHSSTGLDVVKSDLMILLLTNPGERCLTGDTEISLANGTIVSIKDLVGQSQFWIYAFDKDSNSIVPGQAVAYKTSNNSELMEVMLDNKKTIKCTPDHLWLLRNGEYRRTDELKIGDSLMPLYKNLNTSGYERIYQPYLKDYRETHLNFVLGKREAGIREVVHHKNLNKLNNDPDNLQWMTCKEHKELHKKINNAFLRKLNDPEFRESWIKKLKSGLGKYYQTHDGNRKGATLSASTRQKLSDNKNKYYKTKKGKENKGLLKELALEQFATKGHPSLGRKHADSSKEKMKKPHPSMQGENNPSKRPEVREKLKLAWEKRKQKKIVNHKVESIRKLDYKEDCYDLKVDKYHNFALSAGVFVHNCMLPQYGTDLRRYFFEPNDISAQDQIRDTISKSISTWEPRITVESISVGFADHSNLSPDDNQTQTEHIVSITIKFFDPNNIAQVDSLVLELPLLGNGGTQ